MEWRGKNNKKEKRLVSSRLSRSPRVPITRRPIHYARWPFDVGNRVEQNLHFLLTLGFFRDMNLPLQMQTCVLDRGIVALILQH